MFRITFLEAELVFTAIWFLSRFFVWKRQGNINWRREAVLLLMYINLSVIIRFVLFPKALADGHVQPLVFDPAAAKAARVSPASMAALSASKLLSSSAMATISR